MHHRHRSPPNLATWLAALAIVAVSCAAAVAAPRTIPVSAGPLNRLSNVNRQADALAFFPSLITIQVGDSVQWHLNGFHTVTFPGTMRPYPFAVSTAATQPLTNDAAGKPFWWSGTAPQVIISPLSVLPQGRPGVTSGAQIHSSGLLRIFQAGRSRPAPFTLTFRKVGVYRYRCAVHPGMRGVIRVVQRTARVPTLTRLAQRAAAQFANVVAQARAIAKRNPKKPARVWVGAGTRSGAEVTAFFPSRVTVSRGTTVTFANNDLTDFHTVTFGPPAVRSQIEQTFVAPQGTPPLPVFNPLGFFSSEAPASVVPVAYDGTNHGNGYLNAGILAAKGTRGPNPSVYRITFTKPGVYRYECVIHPGMDGTIVVT